MSNFKSIQKKLEKFIKKYYTNALIKGVILFFAIGLLYLLFTLLIEHVLWLSPTLRTLLFWFFITVELALFTRFIVFPLAKLFKLQKGIDYEKASKIIGNHFPEVSDKLLNALQLNKSSDQSELLLASIEQKSNALKPIPFRLAINFKQNIKYLKYAAIPVLILLISLLLGEFNWFSDSYKRVVNYKIAYEPPAPFQFFILNEGLQAIEHKDFKLIISTKGNVIPQDVQITYHQKTYYLKQLTPGEFEYVFTQPQSNIEFNVFANTVSSKKYTLEVIKVPTLLSFNMVLEYPSHTKKKDEILKSTGNAIVPQGTKITWNLKTKSTEEVTLVTKDTVLNFESNADYFKLTKHLYNPLDYSLNTSNEKLKNYEHLEFSIAVIKDEYPELNLQMQQDSLDIENLYFYGQISDDYGLSKLQLVYYPSEDKEKKQVETIEISNSNFDEFIKVFPNQIQLQEGISYDLYFEVFDNDVINHYKSTKSNAFNYRKLTKVELEQHQLKEQRETIDDLNKALEKLEEQDDALKVFAKIQKEKTKLNFNDKKKLENFLKRQQQQDEMMQNFNKKAQKNLEDFQQENENKDQFKEDLQQRLKENEEQLKKDEALLKELEELAKKINQEKLFEKLEALAKQNKNKKRSLKQLLELTKRYYVAKKTEKLAEELEKLAEEQEALAEEKGKKNTKKNQDELNKKFEDFQKELDALKKENKELQRPLEMPKDKKKEEDIKKEQQEASKNLEKKEKSTNAQEQQENQKGAKKNQRKAAQKMKQMSEKMNQMKMGGGGGDQISEDIDMLRQILDNLLLFSFNQEDLINRFKNIQINHNKYATHLRKQQELRAHFEHIDDSLFAISLRQPSISERINKEITEVFFNIEKSLEHLEENRLYQGVAAQQYTLTAANTLASFLSDALDNLETQMNPSPGQGEGDDMQLPDIIMSQEELNKQMEEGLKKSEEGQNKDEKEGDKKEDKKGKRQQGQQEGEENSEYLNGELFRIYQQQQQLRHVLENRLSKEGKKGIGGDLLKKMEAIENDLLNKGFTNRTLQKMLSLQHQLLKLEDAVFQQGEDNRRESNTNKQQFNNNTTHKISNARRYFNTTEILNRQALPLQQVYKKKVQDYFKKKNDKF